MEFSFELVDIKCNSVLSSQDSPWGAEDGIRVYFLAFTGSGDRSLLISGREYPPPDIADNLHFKPGKNTKMSNFPPQNAPSWKSDLMDVNDGDHVWVAVIGINEGLPYIGGGGGFGTASKASYKLMQGFAEYAVSIANGLQNTPTGAAVNFGFDSLYDALESLNSAPDCRGVAFAYTMAFSPRYLLDKTSHQPTSQMVLGIQNAEDGLGLIGRAKNSPDCGRPNYEVKLNITRQQQLIYSVTDSISSSRRGLVSRFNPSTELCAIPNMLVWPIIHDHTFTIEPNFYFSDIPMIWRIDDVEIYDANGSLEFNKEVSFPVSGKKEIRKVRIGFDISNVGGKYKINLKTNGDDGNYFIRIALLLRFSPRNPPKVVYEDEMFLVEGQLVGGNQEYHYYVSCLDNIRNVFKKYVDHRPWVFPRMPLVEIRRFERDIVRIARLFNKDIYLRDNDEKDGIEIDEDLVAKYKEINSKRGNKKAKKTEE